MVNYITRAISFGGDSDTIGAIVGSMAEALWGVPKEISDKAFDLLPTDMLNVVGDFRIYRESCTISLHTVIE